MYANIYLLHAQTTILLEKFGKTQPHDSGRCDKNAELKRKIENMLKISSSKGYFSHIYKIKMTDAKT